MWKWIAISLAALGISAAVLQPALPVAAQAESESVVLRVQGMT